MEKKYIIGVILTKDFLKNKNLGILKTYTSWDIDYPKNAVVLGKEIEIEGCTFLSEIKEIEHFVKDWLVNNDAEEYLEDIGLICI